MARAGKQTKQDDSPGAPEWMVTFSDCMTLLLTFFVLLLSFSSFDNKVFRRLQKTFGDAFPYVSPFSSRDKDSFKESLQFVYPEEPSRGSEKATLEQGSSTDVLKETQLEHLSQRKVFLIPSKEIFWGKGTSISSGGRAVLSKMAFFLREVETRIVISESDGAADDEAGLGRAWAVVDYLVSKGVDRDRFSISASGAFGVGVPGSRDIDKLRRQGRRILGITLLQRSVYN